MKDSWVFSNTERQSGFGVIFRQFLRGIFSRCYHLQDGFFLFVFLFFEIGFWILRERREGVPNYINDLA